MVDIVSCQGNTNNQPGKRRTTIMVDHLLFLLSLQTETKAIQLNFLEEILYGVQSTNYRISL